MYLTQALKRTVQLRGGAPSTVQAGRAPTWAETGSRVARLAGALRRLGVSDGDHYIEYYFAVRIGVDCAPVLVRQLGSALTLAGRISTTEAPRDSIVVTVN